MKSICPFVNYLQIEEVFMKDGRSRMEMPFRKELTNPNGFLHGGAICAVADAAMATALVSRLGHGEFFTAKMEIRFKAPSKGKGIVGEGKVDSERGNFFFVKATVREEEGKVVAEAQAMFSVPESQ
jgi:acyl-CoA thioesterase